MQRWDEMLRFIVDHASRDALLRPLQLDATEVVQSPERFGLELGRQLYRAFGIGDHQLASAADLASGRVSL